MGKSFFPFNFIIGILGCCYCLLWQMLKPLYSLFKFMLVVDVVPLSIIVKTDVIAYVCIGRYYTNVWQICLTTVGWCYCLLCLLEDSNRRLMLLKGKNFFPNYIIKIMNIHIFCSPEETMLENWQKLDFNTNYFLF